MNNKILNDVRLSYLTKSELKTINLMKKGEIISGKKTTDNAINIFIEMCLQDKVVKN